jgi:hypothetical protein
MEMEIDDPDIAQEHQLALMELSMLSFVVGDLRANRQLWTAATATRGVSTADGAMFDLITLRDLPQGTWNADTLFLLPSGEDDDELERLAGTWNADSVRWITGEEARRRLASFEPNLRVLEVWWD